MFRKMSSLFLVLVVMSIALAACGGQEPTAAPQMVQPTEAGAAPTQAAAAPTAPAQSAVVEVQLPAVDALSISGDIIVMGSSTVYPLTERMAVLFEQEGYSGRITIDSIGSGAGFERFCVSGESDISNASRPIKASEVESCQAIGRNPIEFRVGTDALAVVVSQQNDFLTNLTMEELALVFSTATNWSDVNPAYPNQPILRYIPGTDSGTFDYFVEEVFASNEEPILSAGNLNLSEDDNVLVQGVLGSPYAIGFFGYAYYAENDSGLIPVSINDVEPSQETVDAATYPLARPLFVYSDAGIMQAKPQVAAFINFYLTYVNDYVVEVGYFPPNTTAINAAKNAWLEAMNMEVQLPAAPEPVAEGMDSILPPVNALGVTGDIIVMGSSTVYPLTERMAVLFEQEGYSGRITIDSIGSGAGFERFCVSGESDISNASRPIKASEVESCQAIGRNPIEFRVGTDALAVVVSQQNEFLTNLTMEELALVFSTATNWNEVNPAFPNQPILRYIPGTDSGTFDYFVEEVFASNEEPILSAGNLNLSEDDNVLVQGVLGSPYAIGFFGYAYYAENDSGLKPVSINSVEPSQETVDAATYPLARPLFIYSDAGIMQAKPQVAAFINFYLTFVNDYVVEVGYFPPNREAVIGAKAAWLNANAGGVTLPEVNALEVTGDIIVMGSSTVYPLTERMAVLFEQEGYSGRITIDSIGSGAGFERFCVSGESDISNASRPIKASEVESCQAIGRNPIEFRVGTDALAVVVSQQNDFLTNLTMEELALVFSTATNWNEVNASFPNQPILRYIPGTDSGTFDYFVEEVFASNEEPILSAGNLNLSEDDNVLVQGVLGSPYAIGFFGYAYYAENDAGLKPVSINGVEPSQETVDAATYPLARPLFIYSDAGIMQAKPQVAAFINFYLTFVNDYVVEVGYFPPNQAEMDIAKLILLESVYLR